MSEHVFKFLLSELNTVRILCQSLKCKGVIEIPLSELAKDSHYEHMKCKLCGNDFDPNSTGKSKLVEFACAAEEMKRLEKSIQVEFVLPDNA